MASSLVGKQAVVVGAGMGGLAATGAIARHFEQVVVVERDGLPAEPVHRPGIPQGRHVHGLLVSGQRALDALFPGFEQDLVRAGAVPVIAGLDVRWERPGYDHFPRRDLGYCTYALSRPAIEQALRRRVEGLANVELRQRCRVMEFLAMPDGATVTGVRCENGDGSRETLEADLVIDASGRGALTLSLLKSNGRSLPEETTIGIDFGYDMATWRRPLLWSLADRNLDAVIATHFHDDHVAGLNLLRDVEGTDVYDAKGTKIGEIDHLIIDKLSGRVGYAVMSFGGFLGLGHSHYPIPWAALSYDVRGHGQSPGARGYIDRFDTYLDDLRAVHAEAQKLAPGKPLVLLGHSRGGYVVTRLTLDHPELVRSCVIVDSGTLAPGPSKTEYIMANAPKPRLSQPAAGHVIYPYLLRGVTVNRVNQVWSADITYVRLAGGFVYLVAVMDWFSRYVLSWVVSITMDVAFCVEALEQAIRHGQPEIFNTDQGAQFTSLAFTERLKHSGIGISMDGRGRALDNVFVERLWRSVKYEEVYLRDYQSVWDARQSLACYFGFYNEVRLHQALGYRTPAAVYRP